jgi:GNAT superfamily N-acetyltransferase
MVCEKVVITVKVFTDAELYELLVDRDAENPWKRFDSLNGIKYFDSDNIFPYLSKEDEKHIYFCLMHKNKIVGMIKLKVGGTESLFHTGWKNWICFVSILPEYQGKGISRKLIQAMFKYAKEKNLNILSSGYSSEGFLKIRKVLREESKNYSVDFLDTDRTIE